MPDTRPIDNSLDDNPVKRLSAPSRNKPEHSSIGDPCAKCGYPAHRHRPGRKRAKRDQTNWKKKRYAKPKAEPKAIDRIIGLDGEGQGRAPHVYNLLAASDETGESWYVAAPSLSAQQSFEFLLSLPKAIIVAFSFNYDITKILQGTPDKVIHRLLHPERRRKIVNGKARYRPIRWEGYSLNYMNGRLTITKRDDTGKVQASVTIWDIWRFFQSRFTKALTSWGVATEEQLEWMSSMKAKRGTFESEDPEEVRKYCLLECKDLALLFRRLIDAHTDAGLVLKSYFGAGSTSSALLVKMGIKDLVKTGPKEAITAIATAFGGGRFEDAWQGPAEGPLYNADINSAYPYHISYLPCLGCGTWKYYPTIGDDDIASATLALVHWTLPHTEPVGLWGPFPVRTEKKAIIYPWSAAGGWVWGKEYISGKHICPHVQNSGAWVYHSTCEHRPFAGLPEYYAERIRVGKNTGPGKVFKLGPNSVYGKLAQSKGYNPPFQSFVWAGVVTSNTRAQLIDAVTTDPGAVLALATDGILSTRPLVLNSGNGLGEWEQTEEGGRFLVRPGVSFPLSGEGTVKARGYGKRAIEEQAPCIREAWEHGHDWCLIDEGERFGGALSEISLNRSGYTRTPRYGEWWREYTIMTFDPLPKRIRTASQRLDLITHWEKESLPYKPALLG